MSHDEHIHSGSVHRKRANRRLTFAALVLASLFAIAPLRAEDQTKPSIQSMIGGFLFDSDHSYVAESEVRVPLLRLDSVSAGYRHYEITPVLREGGQTQLLFSRDELEGDFTLGRHLRLIGVGGYRRTSLQDRPGFLGAYAAGAGLGSPVGRKLPRLEWSATAGGYMGRENLEADWWADVHLAWRAFEFKEGRMLETTFRPWLGLAADVESANDGGRIQGLYKIGPVLEVLTGNGNRARFQARWIANDGNPFFEDRYSGMLLGVEVNASLDENKLFDARDQRRLGWLPLVWGQYDVGYGGSRSLQRTELNAEVHDLMLADHPITGVVWYESRQEWRTGDYDNVSYSVSMGVQTRIGLASPVSQGQPLVLGAEYLHRSAHALDPDADRVPPDSVLPRNSINLGRVRLQTLGWDLPYRDPARYKAATAWLHDFDWRVTLGYDFHHSRDRSNPAAQAGLNWDAATIQGSVVYARGLGSIGNETPDWLGEVGVRRRLGKVFFRYESYGLESHLARGKTAVVGVGFHL